MPKCHDVRQFAPIQPRIERLLREPFRTSEEAIDDSPDSLIGGQCFEMARRQFDGVAGYSTCRSTRATGSIRRARWPPPVRYIGTKADSVFKGLSRRILDLADLRKLIARMAVPYRASAPQEFLSAITPLSSLGLIASGTADPIVASSNSARLHVGSTGRFWREAAVHDQAASVTDKE
jgi:hypothetical protein